MDVHWAKDYSNNAHGDQGKQTDDVKSYVEYFQHKFNNDFYNWLKNEPEVPYQMSWVSNRFDRGNHITFDQAMTLLSNDFVFQDHYNNDKKITAKKLC
jgi:hypothetical protein